VNALAADHPVIAFDNAGVGRSTGQTPDNVAAMARDAVTFINLLGLSEVDLLGFFPRRLRRSADRRRAQTAGPQADPRWHRSERRRGTPVGDAPGRVFPNDAPDPRLPLFFTKSSASRSAGLAFLKRVKARTEDRDTENGNAVTDPQARR